MHEHTPIGRSSAVCFSHDILPCTHTSAALQEPLDRFYKISNGALEAIAELIATFKDGVPPSPKDLYEMLKVTSEEVKAAASGKRSVLTSRESLRKAIEGLLDGLITA